MVHFIPAWYQHNTWHENEQKWYVRRTQTEFDDTVKQIQLFHRNKVYPYQILLLSFAPNFRHFLHRQGVYRAPYWSCFDAIQEIKKKKAVPLSFHNMKWPENIEFVYTPFVVTALLEGEKYAQIEFGEDGNPIEIDIYRNGALCRRNIYDDRGFVSGTVICRDGQPVYQDYLTEKGIWKLRCFQDDGHVEVNPKCPCYRLVCGEREELRAFLDCHYENMEQVIREVLGAYLELAGEKDIFCAAVDQRHIHMLARALKDKRLILSFFGKRYLVEDHPEIGGVVSGADCIITDSPEHTERIRKAAGGNVQKILDISPYDTRVDAGVSQQLQERKILVPVDGMEPGLFRELIEILGRYLAGNDRACVHLFTRRAEYDRADRLLEQVRACLRGAGLSQEWGEAGEQGMAENEVDRRETVGTRFFVEQCVDELSVSKCVREQRVMVDMREDPDLYLQIMAISVGIPQIVGRRTQFVEDGRNGLVLPNTDQLGQALAWYLDGLSNWNDAMVCARELGKRYALGGLISQWREVMEFVGKDTGVTDR